MPGTLSIKNTDQSTIKAAVEPASFAAAFVVRARLTPPAAIAPQGAYRQFLPLLIPNSPGEKLPAAIAPKYRDRQFLPLVTKVLVSWSWKCR